MEASGTGLKASGDTGEVLCRSDGTESSAVIALRDLASSFQMEMCQQIEKFAGKMKAMAMQENVSNSQGMDCGSVAQLDMQLHKAELIMQIQSMVAFITNKLHEHQLMEKIDSEPSVQ